MRGGAWKTARPGRGRVCAPVAPQACGHSAFRATDRAAAHRRQRGIAPGKAGAPQLGDPRGRRRLPACDYSPHGCGAEPGRPRPSCQGQHRVRAAADPPLGGAPQAQPRMIVRHACGNRPILNPNATLARQQGGVKLPRFWCWLTCPSAEGRRRVARTLVRQHNVDPGSPHGNLFQGTSTEWAVTVQDPASRNPGGTGTAYNAPGKAWRACSAPCLLL